MTHEAQKLEPLERQATDLLVRSSGLQYGAITVEIHVEAGKQKRTKLSITKAVVGKFDNTP